MINKLREYGLAKKGVVQDYKAEWDWERLMIVNKLFMAFLTLDNRPALSVKLEPGHGELMRKEYPGIIIPGYYMNKVHWNTVYLDADLPQNLLESFIDEAYDTVFQSLTKKLQKEILETV